MKSMATLVRLTAAAMLLVTGVASAQATKAQAAVAAAMRGGKHVPLAEAIQSATSAGKPISARYEFEDNRLKLSVFVETSGGFKELFFDHTTGKLAQTDKITAGDDIKDAREQSKAFAKAKTSLRDAVTKAVSENPGYIAVDATPVLEGKRVVAEITLMKDGQFKGVSEPLS